mmetsp:Transcript_30404/g.80827  ORF Transcript_30404/g.80827 Transcript_30404/m.80827 type:complete len:125 (+) Transcript_30404:916-1290(+)
MQSRGEAIIYFHICNHLFPYLQFNSWYFLRFLLYGIASLRSFDYSSDNGVSCNFNNDVIIKPGMPAYGPLFFMLLLELANDNKRSNCLGQLGKRLKSIRSYEAVDEAMVPNIRSIVLRLTLGKF